MNCDDFRRSVLPFIDGELAGDEAAAATAHAGACAPCRERAAFERALEARVGAALLSGATAAEVPVLLQAARPAGRPGRLLSLRRVAAAAAVLLVAVQAAWFFCIPPFECAMLQAVEQASEAPAVGVRDAPGVLARLRPPAEIAGHVLDGEPQLVPVGYAGVDVAVRARYVRGDSAFCLLWCDPKGRHPSFRRHITREGAEWWIADENGHRLVAWMCPVTETMCTLVGASEEERLLAVAEGLRHPDE